MILLQSYSPIKDYIVDITVPLIYAVKDKSTGVITLGRFTENDITDSFFSHFLKMLEKGTCDISNYLFLIHKYGEQFKDCTCTATFEIINKQFEKRKMRLVGSENVARYLRTHDVDSTFHVTVSK
nr:MAG TPA: hypothetical protein [Caudoviricetes sp.]